MPVLLARARSLLDEAARAESAADRFCLAHLAALRTAAVVIALHDKHGKPAKARRRLVSVWVLMHAAAPEYDRWSTYFAAAASTRSAVEAGATSAVSARMADEQLRAAREFLGLVEESVGLLAA